MLQEEEVSEIGRQLATLLQARREKLGLSKNALAQRAGLSVQAISFIEGAVNSPSISTFVRLCHALDVSPANILEAVTKKRRG